MIGGEGDVQVDTRTAVLLDHVDVALVGTVRGQEEPSATLGMMLAGRINKTDERAKILFLFDEDGAAAIIAQLIALATRISPEFHEHLRARINEALHTPRLSR
jgi:hypothetical protein